MKIHFNEDELTRCEISITRTGPEMRIYGDSNDYEMEVRMPLSLELMESLQGALIKALQDVQQLLPKQ